MWRSTELVRGLTLPILLLLAACAGAPKRSPIEAGPTESSRSSGSEGTSKRPLPHRAEEPAAASESAEAPILADGLEPGADAASEPGSDAAAVPGADGPAAAQVAVASPLTAPEPAAAAPEPPPLACP